MFKTLEDLKKKDEKPAADNKKSVNTYAGGEFSGLAIEQPDKDDDLKKLINRATNDTAAMASGASSSGKEVKLKLVLYRNGFILDDGEFRSFDKPENKKFIADMKQGKIPPELMSKYKTTEFDLALENKTTQDYKAPPPPSYIAFSGQGMSMGSSVPAGKVDVKAGKPPHVDANKPKTTITLRLHDGTSAQIEVNTTESTATIYGYVQSIAPGNFELISGFPPKPISKNSTVEDSDLCDSRITQKLL